MGMLKNIKAAPLEKKMTEELQEKQTVTREPFGFAEYNPENAEKAGYSNYSYWGSTFRVFLKNKTAVSLLLLLLILLLLLLLSILR